MKLVLSASVLACLFAVSAGEGLPLPQQRLQLPVPKSEREPSFALAPRLNKVGLRLIAQAGVQPLALNNGYCDCGLVDVLEREQVQQTFVLRNDGTAPLVGLRLLPRLPVGMQVLAAISGQKRAAPQLLTMGTALPPLPPRQTLTLFVSLRLRTRPAGTLRETVLLGLPNQSRPVAAVEMRAELVPLVAFSIPAVNFGRIRAGQSQVVPLTLTLNPRLAPLGSTPRLYCSNPDVRIVPVPLPEKDKRRSPLLSKEQQSAGLYAYLLTLPADTPVGTLSGAIRVIAIAPPPLAPLKTNAANLPASPLASDVVADVLRSAFVPIAGQIVGDVSVTPPTLVFDGVPRGKPAARQARLTVKDGKLLQDLQVNSAVPWLSVRLLPAETRLPLPATQNAPTTQVLEILLSPQAPIGKSQTPLTLQFSNGQRLRLLVVARVEAKKR